MARNGIAGPRPSLVAVTMARSHFATGIQSARAKAVSLPDHNVKHRLWWQHRRQVGYRFNQKTGQVQDIHTHPERDSGARVKHRYPWTTPLAADSEDSCFTASFTIPL